VVLAVYVAAAVCLYRRIRGRRPTTPWRVRFEWTLYVVAFVGTLCVLYAYNIEPYWPQVTHVSLQSPKLRSGSRLRMVLISDLHSDGKVRLEKRLPEIIREQHPDVILFAGDTIVRREGVPLAHDVFSQLSTIAPTYVVLGNWDVELAREWHQSAQNAAFFAGTGVHNLTGQAESVVIAGTPVWIAGATTSQIHLLPILLSAAPRDKLSILLFHFPDEVDVVEQNKIDLYLAGHTHCGQIALPFYGALVTYSRFDKKFERGLYSIGDSRLYVNCGIGLEGHPPRARFLCRPEITVFDISAPFRQ